MKTEVISDLVQALGDDKESLLDDVEYRIRSAVEALGSKCFSVIEREKKRSMRYDPPSLDWGKRFILFCRKKTNDGNVLDSPVTDIVAAEVSAAFLEYYQSKSDEISAIMVQDLVKNQAFVNALVSSVQDANIVKASKLMTNKVINDQIRTVVTAALQSAQSQAIGSKIAVTTSGVITKIAASSVGKIILQKLSLYCQLMVAKILTSAAFETMVVAAIKKFTAAAILAAVTHALWGVLGAKVAAAIGSAIVPIISVAILGWVVYEIVHMPEKLAEKLAVEVRANLDGEIGNINQEIATSFYEEIGSNVGGLAASLATSTEFSSAIKKCFS